MMIDDGEELIKILYEDTEVTYKQNNNIKRQIGGIAIKFAVKNEEGQYLNFKQDINREEDLSVPVWSRSFAMTWNEEIASYLAELYDGEIIQMQSKQR